MTDDRSQKSEVRRLLGTRHQALRTKIQRCQRSEIRSQWRGLKPISDVRLLTSGIDDFYDFYGFYDFYDLNDLTLRPYDPKIQ